VVLAFRVSVAPALMLVMLLIEVTGYVGVVPNVKPELLAINEPLLVEIEMVEPLAFELPNVSTIVLAPSAGTDVEDAQYGTVVPYGPAAVAGSTYTVAVVVTGELALSVAVIVTDTGELPLLAAAV
jgi:hypothetical protein